MATSAATAGAPVAQSIALSSMPMSDNAESAVLNDRFFKAAQEIPDLFRRLASPEAILAKGVSQKAKSGMYAFDENGRAVHVGRTRNLEARLRGHVAKSRHSASFAMKRTRKILGKVATYRPAGGAAALFRDDAFLTVFLEQIELIKRMEVRFIEVTDPMRQYFLELYAHLEYDLLLDEFDTH
ncbi:hypothetical protein [Methylocella silvestris]|uniref:GIY-YIG domain-containing protein n=1 Tax=Methylocella silvestris TaxID=199596 RepID=A0A2J7TM75_METSI|nr:hypothetical protein [Methylocella silvestris]PNG27879.1 hypothetical protein CR492_03035 [Methylocella silvestris]